MGEGFSLATIYVMSLVVVVALRGSRIDSWSPAVPAAAFAAGGGFLLTRFSEHRGVLLGLVAVASIAGVAVGAS